MCATSTGTPYSAKAGAAIVAVMIYAGIDGNPIPSTSEAIIVKKHVSSNEPAPSAAIAEASTEPKLVSDTTPMMTPTIAQAIITDSDCFAPSSSASNTSLNDMRVVFLI